MGGGEEKRLWTPAVAGVAIERFHGLCESPPPCPFAIPPLVGGGRRGVWIPASKPELRIRHFPPHRPSPTPRPQSIPPPATPAVLPLAMPATPHPPRPQAVKRAQASFLLCAAFAAAMSPKYGQNPKNTEKSRFFVSFLTDLADFPPYHRSRIRRYCSRKEQASPMRGAQHRNTWSVQTAPFFDGRCFL